MLGRVWPNPDDPYEPQWLPSDVDKAMAFREALSEVCNMCGTREEDWVDANGRRLNPPTLTTTTIKCYGCAELETERKSIPASAKGVRAIITKFSSSTGMTRVSGIPMWVIRKVAEAREGVTLEYE